MLESLFSFDETNYRACQKFFRGNDNQEYYLGEYAIDDGAEIDVCAQRKVVGPYSLIRLSSKSQLYFRRSWAHIRDDAVDVTILWFVKKGSLSVSHQCGDIEVKSGEFTLTRSTTPLTVVCHTDESGCHEVFHIVVPTYRFQGYLKLDVKMGFSLPAKSCDFDIAERMLMTVYEDAGDIPESIEKLLVDSAMTVLAEAVRGRRNPEDAKPSLSETRLKDILRYIEVNLANPNLSAEVVAEGCGISKRYLSYIFRQHKLLFSDVLWEKRLNAAREALAVQASGEIPIAQIAYRTGFKSPSHFSRLFKRVFGVTPRAYRAGHLQWSANQALRDGESHLADTYASRLQ